MRISDWSSDVCSSDLAAAGVGAARRHIELVDGRAVLTPSGDRTISAQLPAIEAEMLDIAVHERGVVPRNVERRHEVPGDDVLVSDIRSEEHTSELQSLMRISYAVFCLKKKKHIN